MAPFRSLTKLSTEHLNGTCSDWLKASPKGEFHARCSYCQQCFVIGYMGRSAFKNHEKSRKHRGKVAAAKNTPLVFGFQCVIRSDDVTRAEKICTVFTVVQNNSFASNNILNKLFFDMLHDSEFAKSFKMSVIETKTKHSLEYGLQVQFQNLLSNIVQKHILKVSMDGPKVCQGVNLSPILFSIFFNDVEDDFIINGCKYIEFNEEQ